MLPAPHEQELIAIDREIIIAQTLYVELPKVDLSAFAISEEKSAELIERSRSSNAADDFAIHDEGHNVRVLVNFNAKLVPLVDGKLAVISVAVVDDAVVGHG